MIVKTKAIVLHQLKYAETSVIVTMYTRAFGRQSYLINGVRSTKTKQKSGIYQALFLLDADVYHKGGRDLQRIKECRLGLAHNTIPFHISKSTISMFLAEVLYKVLRSEETDEQLFDFIWQSIDYFDTMEQGSSNFHLWFLVKLAGYLGFRLENNYSDNSKWFNYKTGSFVQVKPVFPNTPNINESAHLAMFIEMLPENINLHKLNGEVRSRILEIIIEYYTLHFDLKGSINSLKIMRELFE